MELLLNYLSSIHPLSENLVEYLAINLKTKKLLRKDFLLRAGQTCNHIYFVNEGLIRCYYLKGDYEVCTWFMKEGDVITSIESFFQQVPSYEYIQAVEDCKLYYINFSELQFIYKSFPEFNFIGRELITKYYVLWAKQLYGIRMQQASERYKWLMDSHPELVLRVPAKYIASYLGITEVTFSKMKSR